MSDQKLSQIVDVISESKSIETLYLNKIKLRPSHTDAILQAIIKQKQIKNLTLNKVQISCKNGERFIEMIQSTKLQTLKMTECGVSDLLLNDISQGIKMCPNLATIDLSNNMFESEHTIQLMEALRDTWACQRLTLSGLKIEGNEAKQMALFFGDSKCGIRDLSLSEIEFDNDSFAIITQSLQFCKELVSLSLSDSSLNNASIQQLMSQFQHKGLQSLSLSRCQLSNESFQLLCKVLGQGQNKVLKFLDVSWNHLDALNMPVLCDLLNESTVIGKLILHHNKFGAESMRQLSEMIGTRPSLQYIDVSANHIGPDGFLLLMEAISKPTSKLHTLQCRKNEILGEKIEGCFDKLSYSSCTLSVLNLKHNQLTSKNAEELLEYSKHNFWIESINLKENIRAPYQLVDQINHECKTNLQIREFVVPKLSLARETGFYPKSISKFTRCFINYDVRKLVIRDESYLQTDFVVKFMLMNQNDFEELRLINVNGHQNLLGQKLEIISIQCPSLAFRRLHLENINIDLQNLRKTIISLENHNLTELRLIQIPNVARCLDLIRSTFTDSKLKILDLKDNNLRSYKYLTELLAEPGQGLQELDIRGNKISEEEVTEFKFCLHLFNTSLLHLRFDSNKDWKDVQNQIDAELQLNQDINDEILPNLKLETSKAYGSLQKIDLSGYLFKSVDALVKFAMIHKTTSLIMAQTHLTNEKLNSLVQSIVMFRLPIYNFDFSGNPLLDNTGCEDLVKLLQIQRGQIKKQVNLSHTKINEAGLETLIQSLEKNNTVGAINLSNTSVSLPDMTSTAAVKIVASLKQNCSLIALQLDQCIVGADVQKEIDDELEQNKLITELIFPMLTQQGAKEKHLVQRNDKPVQPVFDLKRQSCRIRSAVAQTQKEVREKVDVKDTQVKKDLQSILKNCTRRNSKTLQEVKTVRKLVTDFNLDQIQPPVQFKQEATQEKALSSFDSESNSDTESKGSFLSSANGFQLSLSGKNLQNLQFLTKFIRCFPNIKAIDLGNNQIGDVEMKQFVAEALSNNSYIQDINFQGNKKVRQSTRFQIMNDVKINREIEKLKSQGKMNEAANTLQLQDGNYQDVNFLSKLLMGNSFFETLNFSNNNLGNAGARQVSEILRTHKNVKRVILSNNNIGREGLGIICSALANKDCQVEFLDISNNNFEDKQLKALLVLLYKNDSIIDIKYSMNNEANNQRLQMLDNLRDSSNHVIIDHVLKHHSSNVPLWQKIIFPIWCFKKLMDYKHEAFRFKYDTESLLYLEQNTMKWLGPVLFANGFLYYVMVIAAPLVFIQDCQSGIGLGSHYVFVSYLVMNIILEVTVVLMIQRKIQNKDILQFNIWHFIELFMGLIARFDTYLDVCLACMFYQCEQYFLFWPVVASIGIAAIYPFVNLCMLMCPKKEDKDHTLPLMERNCQLSFIRENMLLATVLDSFCIENHVTYCGKTIVFGKIMGALTFLLQDFPQFLIHIAFLIWVHDGVPHEDETVKMSLGVSCMAVCVSLFNFIVSSPNEFDPILLQIELKHRKEKRMQKKEALATSLHRSKSNLMNLISSVSRKALVRQNSIQRNRKSIQHNEQKLQVIYNAATRRKSVFENIQEQSSQSIASHKQEAIEVQEIQPQIELSQVVEDRLNTSRALLDDFKFESIACECGQEGLNVAQSLDNELMPGSKTTHCCRK